MNGGVLPSGPTGRLSCPNCRHQPMVIRAEGHGVMVHCAAQDNDELRGSLAVSPQQAVLSQLPVTQQMVTG